MQPETRKLYRQYQENLANSLKMDKNGDLIVYDLMPEHEKKLFQFLRNNSFFGLINLVKSQIAQGDCLGLQVPMPSTTDTDTTARQPSKGYIQPFQKFNCEQINIDTCISYAKLDALADYLDVNFEKALDYALDKQSLLALLMVGWNGKQRVATSDPNINKLAQDVKKGWLQQLRETRPSQVINGANVGSGQTYNTLNALIKAGLAKIDEPIRSSGELVAICGRDILADHPINIFYSDFDGQKAPRTTISQKQIGGLKAIGVPYFPADSVLITRLDNLSLYVHTGTIRRMFETNPSRDRLENYFSLSLDFIIEDYNAAVLIEKIKITE